MKKNRGLVLKKFFPYKCKVIVLDNYRGKIDAIPSREDICLGAYIDYYVEKRNSIVFMREIEHVYVPFALARHDLLFIHYLLEVCYFCVPFGVAARDIFFFLAKIYELDIGLLTDSIKKIIALKLFMMLGVYPEDKRLSTTTVCYYLGVPVDTLTHQSIDLEGEYDIDKWLYACIEMHPGIDYFKTIYFLNLNRSI